MENNISEKIMDYIDKTEFGASASQIAKGIGHNRITVSKYLEVMQAHGKINSKGFAQAKLWRMNNIKKKKVMIIDDESHIVNLIKLSLDSDKYDMHDEASGQNAIEALKRVVPDLLILDLMMPKVSGYDVLEAMKKDSLLSKIPVIVLSAKTQLDDKIKAADLGADDYLTKPFDPVELDERVKVILAPLDVEQKIHPISHMLTEKTILSWVDKKIKDTNERFEVISLNLEHFADLKKSNGTKSANETLKLISKLITQIFGKLKTKCVIGHTNNDKFVIVRDISKSSDESKEIIKSLMKEFDNLLPFIYHNTELNKVKNKINLSYSIIKGKDIISAKHSMFDILK